MKAYKLLSRLRYLKLMDPEVDNNGRAWNQEELIGDAFEGTYFEHELVRAREGVYIELANMGKI